jgi:DHA2 family multidrug resistance protein-like MFS transporter
LSETSAELGGALGIALFGSIGIAVYRLTMDGRIPASLSATDAESARATLGGAVTAASRLAASEGAVLIDSGRGAFVSALQLCAVISMVGSLALAVFVMGTMRHLKRPS